jgi:hypothetical protein
MTMMVHPKESCKIGLDWIAVKEEREDVADSGMQKRVNLCVRHEKVWFKGMKMTTAGDERNGWIEDWRNE